NNRTDQVRQGLEYAKHANKLYEKAKDSAGLVAGRNVEGILFRSYAKLGDSTCYDSAMACYQDALAMITRSGKGRRYIGILYNNISQFYIEYKRDYPAALRYLQAAVQANQHENTIIRLSYNYGNIAHVYQLMGNRRSSLDYAYRTLDYARRTNITNRILNAYKQLFDSYDMFGPADSALRYYLLYDGLRDSIAGLDVNRQIAEIQTKYESEKNKALIERLNMRNSEQKEEILFLVSGIALLLLFLAGLFLLFRRVRRQKDLIARQSGELGIMMKELHHRVKNNLQVVTSLLSLQSYRLKDEEAFDAIRLSRQRVQAMSFIHQRLYMGENSRSVDMEEYLYDLARSLITAYGYVPDDFDLRLEVTGKWMDVDKALPLGLIANEIITNALKYAYTGHDRPSLHIRLTADKEGYLFLVKDNGCNWDEKQWLEANSSFGRQLVTSLCRQLNATEALTIDNGAIFTFIIPLEIAA
ncbi:MAG TPA: histidine kinase dimerization/phosphoacceptor domain -containing protein, partial [Puia sp.]|nr:histidine kinase dimerization/phosphoacceptor domain -containing protein [Puia sp.]